MITEEFRFEVVLLCVRDTERNAFDYIAFAAEFRKRALEAVRVRLSAAFEPCRRGMYTIFPGDYRILTNTDAQSLIDIVDVKDRLIEMYVNIQL